MQQNSTILKKYIFIAFLCSSLPLCAMGIRQGLYRTAPLIALGSATSIYMYNQRNAKPTIVPVLKTPDPKTISILAEREKHYPESAALLQKYLNDEQQNREPLFNYERTLKKGIADIARHGQPWELETQLRVLAELKKIEPPSEKSAIIDELSNQIEVDRLIAEFRRSRSNTSINDPANIEHIKQIAHAYLQPPYNKQDYRSALHAALDDLNIYYDSDKHPILWELWKTEADPERKIAIGAVGMHDPRAFDKLPKDPAILKNLGKKNYLLNVAVKRLNPDLNDLQNDLQDLIQLIMKEKSLSYEKAVDEVVRQIPSYNKLDSFRGAKTLYLKAALVKATNLTDYLPSNEILIEMPAFKNQHPELFQ